MEKLDSRLLREAAIWLAEKNGGVLRRADNRAQLFKDDQTGDLVLLRTSNDRCLQATATNPDPLAAALDFEARSPNLLLIAMPTERRGFASIEAYLVPTELVSKAIRECHSEWLKTAPATKGRNQTFAIWFDDDGASTSNRFAERWSFWRLKGTAAADQFQKRDAIG